MATVTLMSDNIENNFTLDKMLLAGKRHLTQQEIDVLKANGNINKVSDWMNIYVNEKAGEFDPECIFHSTFNGFVVIGCLKKASVQYHDLRLDTGIYHSNLKDVVIGDFCAIHDVKYLVNYRIKDRVILFNIGEMQCTLHSKFGEGLLKEGENESSRIWIGVGNENDGRSVLAFEDMIPADAYLWSRYREDSLLMQKFIELTEYGKSKKNDTYGIVESDAVIKNCSILKDVKVGSFAYIKGAFKLKNITVCSSELEPTQIGEGVELVNGILGYGCKVFYQAVAVRFVIGRNCQLKYGARLLNSVLGDNSTVSCCELLNNLIFPFHEQHHNSSFLIASTIMGQSNIASAATIGSNHNSRSPDCEMIAGRGFWPGLCSDFKFDSRFASFVLASKGSYQHELNITYPFSLISPCPEDGTVHILPAYWFMYNMFAIARNKFKFASRDKRLVKVQHIETNPFAPDTIQEIHDSINRIIELTSRYLKLPKQECERFTEHNENPEILEQYRAAALSASTDVELYQISKDYLHKNYTSKFILSDDRCQNKFGARIYKPGYAYKEYRKVVKYFAAECLIEWVGIHNKQTLTKKDFEEILKAELFYEWVNVGGQVIPSKKLEELFDLIKSDKIKSWQQVHEYYKECQRNYCEYKARYAVYLMEFLYSKTIGEFEQKDFLNMLQDVATIATYMFEASISAREKDFTDFFRSITFRNEKERETVIGALDSNGFLKILKNSTDDFISELNILLENLV